MLSLQHSFENIRHMKAGDSHAQDSAVFSGDNLDFEPVIYSYADGSAYVFYLNKISNNAYAKMDVDTTRTGDASATDHGRIYEIGTNDNQVLTETQGGNLLTLANNWKDYFFGGVTQTAASLYAWMCDHYGNAHGFKYTTITNALLFSLPLWGELQAQEVGWSKVEASRGVDFILPEKTTISGYDYGTISIPSEVTGYGNIVDYMFAALVFDPHTSRNELQFDVYVDGTQDPNITINWQALTHDDNFSLQLVSPIVWTLPKSSAEPSYPYIVVDGLFVPNEANSMMRKHANTWPGSYFNPYLTEFNGCTDQLDTFTKTQRFGTLGIASSMQYLLRFNKQKNENNQGVMTWGDLFIVEIPRSVSQLSDVTVTRLDPSMKEAEFTTKVVVHLGAPPDEIPDDDDEYPDGEDSTGDDPGVYEPDKTPHDFDPDEADGYPGHAVLTKTYSMDAAKLANVGSKLWSQAYFDVTKIQSNPIENIVSMKWFPFSVTGINGRIKVGDVDFQIDTDVVSNIYKFEVGSVTYQAQIKDSPTFLDLSPYTQLKLHLPYCGVVQLDATEMLNRKLTVKYTVDLVSGDCMAFLYLDDNVPYMNVAGHCGVDVPLTSSNRVQTELRAASTTLSAVTGAAGHVLGGDYAGAAGSAMQGMLSVAGMDYTCQRTASHSPACTSTGNRAVYLEVWRPAFKISEGFKSRHGYPCHLFKALGTFTGFVKCDARTKLDFACTSEENEMLEKLLTEGVYITPRDPSWSPT